MLHSITLSESDLLIEEHDSYQEVSGANFVVEHLIDLLGSLSHIEAKGIVIIGPCITGKASCRTMFACHPDRFNDIGKEIARSNIFGSSWRKSLSPAAAYVNLTSSKVSSQVWIEECRDAGALSLVWVDMATSMNCGFEVYVFFGTEHPSRSTAAEVTYAILSISPTLRAELPKLKIDLSAREMEVLRCGAKGLTAKDTAELLHATERTVIYYWDRILTKFQAKNKSAALVKATTYGLI